MFYIFWDYILALMCLATLMINLSISKGSCQAFLDQRRLFCTKEDLVIIFCYFKIILYNYH